MYNKEIVEFNIKELISGNAVYSIPVYQRNYAWGEKEINQLIQDLIDTLKENSLKNYYLGTLVVYQRNEEGKLVFETIDGQQRLTTLNILMTVLKHEWKFEIEKELSWFQNLNLEFKSRDSSTIAINHLFHYGGIESSNLKISSNILGAYVLIKKQLKKLLEEEGLDIIIFLDFLIKNVKILRVPVPYDTDLNHYFEIINTRGEQLEKHEIVKANLLKVFTFLKDDEEAKRCALTFNMIWEATSNMEKYLQYGFTPEHRSVLFGSDKWNSIEVHSFDDFKLKTLSSSDKGIVAQNLKSIDGIIAEVPKQKKESTKEEVPDRFYSVINFENFLLHVLRLMKGTDKDIPLDDKRLIAIFSKEIEQSDNKIEFVKEFCYQLFRVKFLFDKYIIKREFIGGKDSWSFKKLRRYDGSKASYVNTFGSETDESDTSENRTLLMLLSMFHVSTPTMVYKHWLSGALKFPFESKNKNGKINSKAYIEYLEDLAKKIVFGRHLRSTNIKDYYPMIFGDLSSDNLTWTEVDLNKLTFGNISNNLVFNYIDYLYWKDSKYNDENIKKYEFSYRSSVEHYYPQNPKVGGVKKLETQIETNALNCIGNLCLISHSKNSALSNFSPLQKKEFYNKNIDSIKQYIMINSEGKWDVEAILKHNEEVKTLLKTQLT
jgi:hypothetical protein